MAIMWTKSDDKPTEMQGVSSMAATVTVSTVKKLPVPGATDVHHLVDLVSC